MGDQKLLTLEAEECIEESDLIIGAARMVELFADGKRPQFIEYRPERIRDYLVEHIEYEKCAVLFSGDTGFYSGAKALVKVLEESGIAVQILPESMKILRKPFLSIEIRQSIRTKRSA